MSDQHDGFLPVFVRISSGPPLGPGRRAQRARPALPQRVTAAGRTRRARPARPARAAGPLKRGVPRAEQRRALYRGCDVVLQLDGTLKLRGAAADYVAAFYALVLEHCRHDPRSVHIIGATTELRLAAAGVVSAAFPHVVVTIGSTVAEKVSPGSHADAVAIFPARVEPREAQADVDASAVVRIIQDWTSRSAFAQQSDTPLFPGCDVQLHVDLSLRDATLRTVSTAYSLALDASRHEPRSVLVAGGAPLQRGIVAVLIATAFPDCYVARLTKRSGLAPVTRRVPGAHVVNVSD